MFRIIPDSLEQMNISSQSFSTDLNLSSLSKTDLGSIDANSMYSLAQIFYLILGSMPKATGFDIPGSCADSVEVEDIPGLADSVIYCKLVASISE